MKINEFIFGISFGLHYSDFVEDRLRLSNYLKMIVGCILHSWGELASALICKTIQIKASFYLLLPSACTIFAENNWLWHSKEDILWQYSISPL